jgi:predicted kinase
MPILTVMVGIPGAGKSTYRKKHFEGAFVASTDDYIESKAVEYGTTYNQCFKEQYGNALEALKKGLKLAIEQRRDVVYDQTNLTAKKRKAILSQFPSHYERHCVVAATEDIVTDVRNASRPEGRKIPREIIDTMRQSYQVPQLNEGFDKITFVDGFGNEVVMRG